MSINFSKGKFYYFICIFFSFSLIPFSAVISYAHTANSDQRRMRLINQELNCLSQSSVSPPSVNWEDVCWGGSSYYDQRLYAINQTLDTIERRIEYQETKPRGRISGDTQVYPAEKEIPYDQLVRENMTLRWDAEEGGSQQSIQRFDFLRKPDTDKKWELDFQVLLGQRIDEVRFDIAGNLEGTEPNVLSELTWSDLKMRQIKATANLAISDRFLFDGMIASADIYQGDNQDSDYLGDNRSMEFSRSNNRSDDGDVFDLATGIGYRFHLKNNEYLHAEDINLSILAGYSYHEQNLIITDGNQTKDPYGLIGFTGPFDGLHSSFETEWKGPWLGLALSGKVKKFNGLFRFEYHYTDYYAWANWNLREDFAHPVSFEQTAEGHGLAFTIGLDYELTNNFTIDFNADIQSWLTEPGIIEFHLADGTSQKQRLNRVDWRSYAFMLGSTYHFN